MSVEHFSITATLFMDKAEDMKQPRTAFLYIRQCTLKATLRKRNPVLCWPWSLLTALEERVAMGDFYRDVVRGKGAVVCKEELITI